MPTRAALLAVPLLIATVLAHSDEIAPLLKVEKVYAAPQPLGETRIVYNAPPQGGAALSIECKLFQTTIATDGLADLPRPDWSAMEAAYSLTSGPTPAQKDRPYVIVQVPLHGPAGQSWERTWVSFLADADGKVRRYLKRFKPGPKLNVIHTTWKEWPIGSTESAESIFAGAEKE